MTSMFGLGFDPPQLHKKTKRLAGMRAGLFFYNSVFTAGFWQVTSRPPVSHFRKS